MSRVYLFRLYDRIWHWAQATLILLLLWTGIEMHWPGSVGLFGFRLAVSVHNLLGFLLLGNAFLALFYHLASGEIRQYLPEPRDFVSLSIRQARYYLSGMFRGEPHPFERSPLARLNPLQKIAYLVLLNVLLPLQALSGVLMWGAQRWPGAVEFVGGLGTLAKVHTLVAWLLAAFLVMHLYLITTGPTPLSHLRAMIVGWDHIEEPHVIEKR